MAAFGRKAGSLARLRTWATGIDAGCAHGGSLTAITPADGEQVPREMIAPRELIVIVPAEHESFGLSGSDPDDLAVAEAARLVRAGKTPVIVQPNAGSPRLENDCAIYDATPEQMADTAQKLLGVGVRIIGGFCGTTPAHLAAMSHAIKAA